MPNNEPKTYIYFRIRSAPIPATINPDNLNPSSMGIQISSVRTWQIQGTPALEFAAIGKGPKRSPTSAPSAVNPDDVWSLQGAEVRIYHDFRTTASPFSPDGVTNCPLVFCGDVHEIRPLETPESPWHAFACAARGLVSRAERVPVASPIDNSDSIRFNMNALLSEYQPTTGGKSLGNAIKMVLNSFAVAFNLYKNGIGLYTFKNSSGSTVPNTIYNSTTGTYSLNIDGIAQYAVTAELNATTASDLDKITLVPPFEFRISGDNAVASIQQTLDAYCPNFGMIVLPTGLIRFYDMRVFAATPIDLQDEAIDGFSYSKSTLGSYSRVMVRGGPKVVPYYCQWSIPRSDSSSNLDDSPDLLKFNGSLVEFFDSTGLTNTTAKEQFQHSDYTWGRTLLSTGDVYFSLGNTSLPSNQIRLVPDTGNISGRTTPNLKEWVANELTMLDSGTASRRECRIVVRRKLTSHLGGSSVDVRVDSGEFLVSANEELLNPATTCNITTAPNVDRPPANTANYTYTSRYELYGYTRKGSATWRRYKVQLDGIASTSPLMTTQKGMGRILGTVFPSGADGLCFSQIGVNSIAYDASRTRKAWYPECLVEFRQRSGSVWSYNSFWTSFRIDPTNNIIVLNRPAVIDANNNGTTGNYTSKTPPWDTAAANGSTNQPFQIVPYNIKALLPVYEGTQEAVYPHYDSNGTIASGETESKVKTIYGVNRDLIIHIPDWYDNRDQSYADQYAKELWDSVQQPQIDGGFGWVIGTPDPSTEWDYKGIYANGTLQGFNVTVSESCNSSTGSGVEECSLIMTSADVRYQTGRKPYTVIGFSTAKPRSGMPMRDFHSFEDHLARDPNII